jgi:putative SOS response-associated peptidase YedK
VCGRYELHSHPAAIALTFGLAHPPDVHPRYNIAPMTEVPIVRVSAEGRRECVRMRWGLVPRWAKDPSIGAKMINARGETIAEKPSFRTAYRRHRCLLPADGFYEWMPSPVAGAGGDRSRKQPVHVGMKHGGLFGMAGLHERWLGPEGEILDTCTIVTTSANAALQGVHDRMPVIIAPEHYARWLDPGIADVPNLVAPFPAGSIVYYPVSTRVNNVHHDDPSLIERATPVPADDRATEESDRPRPDPPEQEELF